ISWSSFRSLSCMFIVYLLSVPSFLLRRCRTLACRAGSSRSFSASTSCHHSEYGHLPSGHKVLVLIEPCTTPFVIRELMILDPVETIASDFFTNAFHHDRSVTVTDLLFPVLVDYNDSARVDILLSHTCK